MGTDPNYPDSDEDGLWDGAEVNLHGTDPLSADTDGDGLLDGAEVNAYGSNPVDADSDDDGLSDGDEVLIYGTDPTAADSDEDGLGDAEEIALGTDPLDEDTDGDGATDYEEVLAETDPVSAESFPTGEVWVDFEYTGEAIGTRLKPVTSLEAAEIVVMDGGLVRVTPGASPFGTVLGTLEKAYFIYTLGGPVRVGSVD